MATSSGSKRYFLIAIPFLIIGGVFFVLYSGLSLNPYGNTITMLNKPLIPVKATNLFQWNNLIDTGSFKKQNEGRWYLINVWASWCDTCLNEHPFLMDLARQGITIYGVNNNDAAPAAKKWLATYGNPYTEVLWDARAVVSVSLGVTSVPATFLIDPQGVIRCRVTGPLTLDIWKETLVPLIEKNEVIVLPKKRKRF
jgi:cytochrome c biogenesis protein CcmG/thiol:disulfide interchange protein DsbE